MSVSNTTKRVKEIRRKTRRKFSSEEKSASFWKDCAASARLPNCVAVKASTIICITAGAKTFSKPASGAWPELTPRELARHLTDRHECFISESSVYRSLKAHDLVTSPQFMVMSAADAFQHPTRRVHELWHTDFIIGVRVKIES